MWAFSQVDPELLHLCPPNPNYLGLWQPARLVWHVTEYERCIAMPVMKQWLGEAPIPEDEDVWPDTDELWAMVANQPAEVYVRAFWEMRNQQLDLLDSLESVDWAETRPTVWGDKPLSLVVTKTYQHTFEHGDTLLRMGLWWKDMAEKERQWLEAQNQKSDEAED